MPFDGSGNYTASPAPNFPAVGGAVIASTYYNAVINDIVVAFNNCLTRDSQGKPSAAINWNAQNLTNVNTFGAVAGTFTGALTLGTSLVYGAVTITAFSIDGTLVANSDGIIPTQKAVKTYADSVVVGLLDYKGATDCSANPNYPVGVKGDMYVVSVAGKIGGAAGVTVRVDDVYFAKADNAGGTQAAVGTSWSLLSGTLSSGLLAANNLSELTATASTARTNIGAAARTPVVQTVASAATVTPTFADDMVTITAQAAALLLANPTGTALEGWGIAIRIKDNGTARAITYGAQYRAVGITLPTTTVINKTLYLGMIFNNTDTKWDVVSVMQQA